MLVTIASVLGPAELQAARQLLDQAPFIDGKLSAGMAARRVKQNEEVDQASDVYKQLNGLVMSHLIRHPVFRSAVLPHKLGSPFYARYTEGMGYGDHVDDPVMGSPHHYRSDVSTTVFLNEPEEYEGGELIVRTTYGEKSVKLPAGSVVVYPSHSMHRINTIRSGERKVMVTWIQSMIRDAEKREILHDLNQVREDLLRHSPEEDATKKLETSYSNLIRMWADV